MRDEIARDLLGVDEIGHAEFARHLRLGGVEIDAHDLHRPGHAQALDDVEPDAPQPEDDGGRAQLHLGGVDHRADARGHAAADIADHVERGIAAHPGEGDLGHHRVVGEGRAAHVVMDRRAVGHGKPRRPVGQKALSLRPADGLAEIGLGIAAILAFAAFGRVEGDHVIAHLEARHPLADLDHHARALVAEDGGKDPLRILARPGELVRVAQPRGLDLDQNLARAGPLELHIHDFQRLARLHRDRRSRAHLRLPVVCPMSGVAADGRARNRGVSRRALTGAARAGI